MSKTSLLFKESGTFKVIAYLNTLSSGTIFTIDELREVEHDVSYTAIRSIVIKLHKKGKILRICRGVYCLPFSGNKSFPTVEEILDSITEKESLKYCPAGEYARYLLGLQPNLPQSIICYSTGKLKSLNFENGISVRLLPSKKKILLSSLNKKHMIAQVYLQDVGVDNIDKRELSIINNYMKL